MRADDRVNDCGYVVHRDVDDHDGCDWYCVPGVDANDERDPSGLGDSGLNDHGRHDADVHDSHGFGLHENRVGESSGRGLR